MRGVLAEILAECHRLLNHLLVQLRGVKQMKTVFAPHGKTQMSDVETGFLSGNGNNVAIFHGLAHGLRIEDL